MSSHDVLLLTTLLIHLVVAMVWWSGGSLLSLSRRAASHWLAGVMAHGLGIALFLLAGQRAELLTLAGSLGAFGFLAIRRGLQWFLRHRLPDRLHAAIALVLVALPVIGAVWPAAGAYTNAGSSAIVVVLAVLTARDCAEGITREFGAGARWAVGAPLLLAAVLFTGRIVGALSGVLTGQPGGARLTAPGSAGEVGLTFAFLVVQITLNFGLAYLVVIRLVAKLRHLSQHDGLTGLLNRRAVETLIEREAQRLQRFGEPYAVLLADVDHFKRINDRLGHAGGDAVLCAVAQVLMQQAREVDRVARYGGEEFCVLLPHTAEEGALHAAQRLRDALRAQPVRWGEETLDVRVSIGVAAAQDGESVADLLRRADQALYAAKSAGRDTVIVAPARQPTRDEDPALAS